MRSNLITAEDLKAAIRACDGITSIVYLPSEAKAVPVEGGWSMTCGPYVLRSARVRKPRVFRTIDALVNAAKQCGIEEVQVALELKRCDEEVQVALELKRCEDCEHHLGDVVRALRCPRFGQPRHGIESRCPVFQPKSSERKP